MPSYTFRNKETGEGYTEFMSISSREDYLRDNPHIEQVIVPVAIGDSWSLGIAKPPSDFSKYVLGKVQARTAGATAVGTKRWGITKEI